MSLSIEEINNVIEKVEKQLSSFNSALELTCMLHRTGKRKNACLSLRKGYSGEDIYPLLNKLFTHWMNDELKDNASEFMGTIETYKSLYGGLIKKQVFMNFIALNTDNYSDIRALEIDLYRLSWNACNAIKNTTDKKKTLKERILIPSPKGIRKLGNNLQADIFGALTYSIINKEDFVEGYGRQHAHAIVSASNTQNPENHPYIMTLDQSKYMYNQLASKRKLTSHVIDQVWAASKVIIQTMNQQKLEVWEKFALYSQDMAWRGFPAEVILSIAIDHNDDIETKKLGVQVSNLIKTEPISADESRGYYNPFKTDLKNAEIHDAFIEELFENLLTRAVFENSSDPFIEKADEQNRKLQKGQFMGWCASALQEAAVIFDKSIKAKQPPTQTTREIFKVALSKVSLMKLKSLGEELLAVRKEADSFKEHDFIDFLNTNYSHKIIAEFALKSLKKNRVLTELSQKQEESEMDEIYGSLDSFDNEKVVRH